MALTAPPCGRTEVRPPRKRGVESTHSHPIQRARLTNRAFSLATEYPMCAPALRSPGLNYEEKQRGARMKLKAYCFLFPALVCSWAVKAASPADEAAKTMGEPVHPHSRWEPGYSEQPWTYEYRPGRWQQRQTIPHRENPYPPGRWHYPGRVPMQGGYPPSQWYTPPHNSPYYGDHYPPRNWYTPGATNGWNRTPSYRFWERNNPTPQWQYAPTPGAWNGQ